MLQFGIELGLERISIHWNSIRKNDVKGIGGVNRAKRGRKV